MFFEAVWHMEFEQPSSWKFGKFQRLWCALRRRIEHEAMLDELQMGRNLERVHLDFYDPGAAIAVAMRLRSGAAQRQVPVDGMCCFTWPVH